MSRFTGKVALVTGAASGIGAATAALFAREGATVVGWDLADAEGVRRVDVTDSAAAADAVRETVREHGRLDVVTNVAGMVRMLKVDDLDLALWQQHLALNLTAPFVITQAALPALRESKGCVVNVASIAGLRGQAYTAAYCASKGGLVQLTKSMALELAADGVRINAVCPGGVDTPLLREVAKTWPDDLDQGLLARTFSVMPGLTQADEVAQAVAYLASDAARSITGTALVIDRGSVC
ncbi:MAG: SDR family oxidoreductase [Mycobacteriales bacterium]|nr:SDR family oxidoreductase [Mycobacteriales bacterium]